MSRKMIYIIFIIITFSAILSSCRLEGKGKEKEEYKITNISIYKGTPVWKLALAVRDQEVKIIEKIAQDKPELIDYQEPKYGATLLLWAIGMEKYNSAEALLKCGADPNIASTVQGNTPLFIAAGYSWVDKDAKKDPKYVQLLLRYGANPNIAYSGYDDEGNELITEPGTTPLMYSIGSGIEKTIALVEAGADIEYKTESGRTASVFALKHSGEPEYAYYLIVQRKATISEPYYTRPVNISAYKKKELYPVDLLRRWIFDLGSEKYKLKMEIVDEFSRQGVNYWDTEIDKHTLDQIKNLYPDSREEYIQKY
ncbi:ankyrin repeat domain-containing protein [Alkaliphilus sp. MSJ-5]|uniref:Ankyrin repeat domain-containing protein n=1 Tax=Alkaliphilus flagellatus TaxID=2841507 RepID=A0ABS6G1W6_9FIRM|nr:ankyrin repeat domain-containing protein [Alkaliphilus flagellatus]MBU5676151.1 ankyrin repeat domain-containing protein [Alkaliphilus flagellatus]